MGTAKLIKSRISRLQRGKTFTSSSFLNLGSRTAVDKTLSRLVKEGEIERISRGVFVRPKHSPHMKRSIMPSVNQVIKSKAKVNNEKIQIHGAEAARRFNISTQMPTQPIYYTTGTSREIQIGRTKVKLEHVTSQRKFQKAGSKVGDAISALWYLGKEQVNADVVKRIKSKLTEEEFTQLCNAQIPGWMREALNQ